MPPLVQAGALAAAMWGAAQAAPGLAWTFAWQVPLAIGLGLAGACLAAAGVLAFRRARTTVDPRDPSRSSELVASGIYRFTRNPMYLGFLLLLAAWGLFLGHAVALAALPAFVAYMNRFQIAPEERALRARFGESFLRYQRSVRRWL